MGGREGGVRRREGRKEGGRQGGREGGNVPSTRCIMSSGESSISGKAKSRLCLLLERKGGGEGGREGGRD